MTYDIRKTAKKFILITSKTRSLAVGFIAFLYLLIPIAVFSASFTSAELEILKAHQGEYSRSFGVRASTQSATTSESVVIGDKLVRILDTHGGPIRLTKRFQSGQVVELAAIADELIVGAKDGTTLEQLKARLTQIDYITIRGEYPKGNYLVVGFSDSDPFRFEQRADEIRALRGFVEHVEPNIIFLSHQTFGPLSVGANDPYYASGQLWGLNQINDIDIDAPEAWAILSNAEGVKVCVIDTGLEATHPDIASNFSGLQYDFIFNDAVADDLVGHGTHVAGTIGAQGNNGLGVTGVAWDVDLMAAKALGGPGGGSPAQVAAAITWAVDNGAQVINGSFGASAPSPTIEQALSYAEANSVVCVFSAGNSDQNSDIFPQYPAAYSTEYDNIISVGAISQAGNRATVADWHYNNDQASNWGPTSVNVFAPGTDIWSTIPGGNYIFYDGTSMASPHVAGVAALVIQRFGGDATSVIDRIENSVALDSQLAGLSTTEGRVNLRRSLSLFSDLPSNSIGWRQSPWLGWLNDKQYPWIYHDSMGWLYTTSTDLDDVWIYHQLMDAWLWTNQNLDSFYYRSSDGVWLYYQPASKNPQFWNNTSTDTWETY